MLQWGLCGFAPAGALPGWLHGMRAGAARDMQALHSTEALPPWLPAWLRSSEASHCKKKQSHKPHPLPFARAQAVIEIISNPVNSTVPIASEILKAAGACAAGATACCQQQCSRGMHSSPLEQCNPPSDASLLLMHPPYISIMHPPPYDASPSRCTHALQCIAPL